MHPSNSALEKLFLSIDISYFFYMTIIPHYIFGNIAFLRERTFVFMNVLTILDSFVQISYSKYSRIHSCIDI